MLRRTSLFLLLAACGSGAQAPQSYSVSGAGITVRVDASPLAFTILDGTGRAVLASHPGPTTDGYGALGWAGGDVTIRSTISPGYFATNLNALGAWSDGYEVATATPGTGTLDLVLASTADAKAPHLLVHIALRPSAARFEVHSDGPAPRAWSAAFASPAGEGFLGLGERFTRTNFRGLRMYSWAEEGGIGFGEGQPPGPNNPYPNGEAMSYYPVPFLISTGGYGFWLDSTWWNEYDLDVEHDDAWRVWHIGPTLAFEVYTPIPGDARPWPYQLVDLFTAATGRPMLPPAWSFGPRRRFAAGDMIGDKTQAQAMRDLDLAITAYDDTNHFLPRGEPPGQAADRAVSNAAMRKLGYRAACYFNPFFSDNPADPIAATAQSGADLGFFLKNIAGDFSKGWILTGGDVVNLYMLDFTSAAAGGWYTSQFDAATGAGYSGWMYDFGEYTQADAVGANGMSGEELHNLYPVLYQKAAHDKLESGPLAGDWLLYARSGYTGASQYLPMVWSGDPAASFDPADGLPSMVRGAINMGASGVPNWGGDIGGYHCIADGAEKADGELLTRWIEEGSMEPDMHDENACVGSDESQKASIWTSSDAQAAWKTYARLHTRLQPYYVALATLAHQTGAPIIRHVFFEHPDRADWAGVDDAYYLGPAFFVAPVVTRGALDRTVELPAGAWLDWTDATVIRGGATVTIPAPLGKLPLLLRDGGLVPMLDPTIDTLSDRGDDGDPSVVTPADVAGVYDVVAFLTAHATFTLADGTAFRAALAGAVAAPSLPLAPDDATLATCSGCYRIDDLGSGLSRVRITTSGDGTVTAGGLTLTAAQARPRTRWDVYVTAP